MGHETYSKDDYATRSTLRAATKTPVFKHDADIRAGKVAAKVADRLSPMGGRLRESRDSAEHPVTVPVAVIMDTTGSMASVPQILEERLSHLMGAFLDDKVSGKRYLGDGYPAILVGALDDYDAMKGSHRSIDGTLQIGQFESGIQIDDDLEHIWLTQQGGGTYQESYELALYFMARHSAHDHMDKRGRKGYLFIVGDEHSYPVVSAEQVRALVGVPIQGDVKLKEIVAEAQQLYHVFFIIPNMTQHYSDKSLEKYWVDLLGQQNVIKLEDPRKICDTIVSCVALCEDHVGLDDLVGDGIASGSLGTALIPLSKSTGEISKYSASNLPVVPGDAGGTDRL